MTCNEFNDLKNRFCAIEKAIKIFDSGNHPVYDEDDENYIEAQNEKHELEAQLNEIHRELCYETSKLAQALIYEIDNNPTPNITEEDRIFLGTLYFMAQECHEFSYNPECYGLHDSYGNGVVDSIGADFMVINSKHSDDKFFDYPGFVHLLSTYDLMEY